MESVYFCDRQQILLNRAINFADRFSTDNVTLDQIASVACLSKYHFSRVFTDQFGESPIAFSSRIKLERAAYMLAFCRNWSILDIANRCGFSSSQTFSRAFKSKFEFKPREFRANHIFRLGSADTLSELEKVFAWLKSYTLTESRNERFNPDIKIIQQPDIPVAYVRNFGEYGSQGSVLKTNHTIKKWAQDNDLWRSDTQIIGASWDSPRITPNQLCRYDACIQLPSQAPIPENVPVQVIPGGPYAVIRVNSPANEIPLIWECFLLLLKDWPRFKNYNFRFGPYYEVFDIDGTSGLTKLDLYAPISAN